MATREEEIPPTSNSQQTPKIHATPIQHCRTGSSVDAAQVETKNEELLAAFEMTQELANEMDTLPEK